MPSLAPRVLLPWDAGEISIVTPSSGVSWLLHSQLPNLLFLRCELQQPGVFLCAGGSNLPESLIIKAEASETARPSE